MKYRRNKVKREHSIIHGALAWLEELTQNSEVMDVIPGVIEANRSPERGIVYKYETQTGCKLLVKSNGSIQEAFVVTKNPAWVKAWIEEHFPRGTSEAKETERFRHSSRGNTPKIRSHVEAGEYPAKSLKHKGSRHVKRDGGEPGRATSGALDAPSLGEQLKPQTLKALRQLKNDLGTREKDKRYKDKGSRGK